jgi:hypothetical protein
VTQGFSSRPLTACSVHLRLAATTFKSKPCEGDINMFHLEQNRSHQSLANDNRKCTPLLAPVVKHFD